MREGIADRPAARYHLRMSICTRESTAGFLRTELANSLTHGVGFALSIAGLVVLVVLAAMHGSALHVAACSIYGATLVLLYLASTLYHSVRTPRLKHVLQVIDHVAIYLLIAGTYTPFTLIALRGGLGWSIFSIIWGLALIGILLKVLFVGRFRIASVVVYLLMGWLCIIALKPLLHSLPDGGFPGLLAGGIAYTVGVVFYAWKSLPYHHAVWRSRPLSPAGAPATSRGQGADRPARGPVPVDPVAAGPRRGPRNRNGRRRGARPGVPSHRAQIGFSVSHRGRRRGPADAVLAEDSAFGGRSATCPRLVAGGPPGRRRTGRAADADLAHRVEGRRLLRERCRELMAPRARLCFDAGRRNGGGMGQPMQAWHIWVLAGLAFLALEMFTPELVLGTLALAMFAAAAAASGGASPAWQLVVFIVATLVLMLAVRPRLKRALYRGADSRPTGVQALIGRKGVVTEPVGGERNPGRVRLGGEEWRAITRDGRTIGAGGAVEVVAVEAATVIVKAI
jgi:hemolysin III